MWRCGSSQDPHIPQPTPRRYFSGHSFTGLMNVHDRCYQRDEERKPGVHMHRLELPGDDIGHLTNMEITHLTNAGLGHFYHTGS
jgi:hypothetical protein